MTERVSQAPAAADSTSHPFPPNPLIDTDVRVPAMAVVETLSRVRDFLALIDHLDPTEFGQNNAAAAGLHWAMTACMDALDDCRLRLKTEVRRHG